MKTSKTGDSIQYHRVFMSIAENFRTVRDRVASAAHRAGRDPESIRIISVSKTFPAENIQEAIDSGIRLFGENRIQEAKNKIPLLKGDFVFHMIGHLQSNKARDAVELFDIIHSIGGVSTAERVNREAQKAGKTQKILIQVNTSGEESKSGIAPEEALELAADCSAMKNLQLLGLMTIGPLTDEEKKIRDCFRRTAMIMQEINRQCGLSMRELSMGMSGDFEIAVEEGATMVRVGSLIFGGRTYP